MSAEREKPMAEADVNAWLKANLPDWRLEDGWVRRTYKTSSWKGSNQALIQTLRQGLGEAFTPEVEASWLALYGIVAETMQQGAAHAMAQPA